MNIAFDLDDILASFQLGWCQFNNSRYGTSLAYDSFTDYNYEKIMNLSQQEVFRRIFELYDAKLLVSLSPVPGAIETINTLSLQHTLSIITSRPPEVREQSEQWLDQYFPGKFSAMYLTGQISRGGHDHKITKADICIEHNIDYLVEDAPVYALQVAGAQKRVFLVTKPWNAQAQVDSPYVTRIPTIESLLNHFPAA